MKALNPYTILFLGHIATTRDVSTLSHQGEGDAAKSARCVPASGVSLVPTSALCAPEHLEVAAGSVAYYPLFGGIEYEWYRYWPSTSALMDAMAVAEADPNIVAHLIHLDSPGGEAFGCHEAFEVVRNLKKPCYAVIRSCAASAAYYLAAAADKIYAESPFSEVGCIGTMCTLVNSEEFFKKAGIKITEVYSGYSPLKNKVFNDALNGATEDFIKRFLDPLALCFINDVASVRNIPEDDDARKGETYYAEEAKRHGLIDGIKSFAEVLGELAGTKGSPSFDLNSLDY